MGINLEALNQDSEIVPMLVKLYDSQQIIDLAKEKDTGSRGELTSIVTSLLEMELSAREAEIVADVLISLMRQVERDLCRALSERLAVMDTVPLRLALHIASESIDIARPMLRHSRVFNDFDLIYIIKSKTPEYWQTIAEREEMGQQVINTLAETKDLETAIKLAENDNITLGDHAINILADMAKGEDRLASPLIRREEITQEIVQTLYQCVGVALKDYIRQEFDFAGEPAVQVVEEVVAEFVEVDDIKNKRFDQKHMKMAQKYDERGVLNLQMTLETLKRGQYQDFVAQFATYTKLTPQAIHDVLMQETGQGLAILCKAEAIQRNDFTSIYLLANRLRSKGGMVDSQNLGRATQYYDGIDNALAEKIVTRARKTQSSIVQL